MKRANVALIIDDIVEVPAMNGVTNRFLSIGKRLSAAGNATCVIADRGGTDLDALRREGLRGFLLPADWLYRLDQYSKVISLLAAHGTNVLHVCNAHTMAARYGFKLAHDLGAYLVVDMHDINADLIDRSDHEGRVIEERQQDFVARHADSICVMSSADLYRLATFGLPKNKLFHSPNGIDKIVASVRRIESKQVVFLGNLFYPPNMEAAKLIADEISGAVRTPGTRFLVIGPCPTSAYGRLARQNVEVLGAEPNLSLILARAAVAIAPLRTGSGMKVKILDYAAHQLPIVCTGIAALGYPSAEGLIVCGTVSELCDEIDKLLHDPIGSMALGRSLSQLMFSRYNWDNVARGLKDSYRELVCRDVVEKPRIDAPDIEEFVYAGMTFPPPIHLLEERYRSARPMMVQSIFEI